MPEAKVLYPLGMLHSEDARRLFVEEIARAVAGALSCRGFNGAMVEIRPDEVDVIAMPYEPGAVYAGSVVLMELAGYEYSDRMQGMRDRLESVRDALAPGIRERIDVGDKAPLSVRFLPIPNACWV